MLERLKSREVLVVVFVPTNMLFLVHSAGTVLIMFFDV